MSSMATRRNGYPPPSSKPETPVTQSSSTSSTASPSQTPPSQPPIYLLLIYPLTLILGSLHSLVSPTANPALAPSIASDINFPDGASSTIITSTSTRTGITTPINYFARKDNILNLYFVKIGWFWTTMAFLALFLIRNLRKRSSATKSIGQPLLRYVLITAIWVFTTQWFFGPALIDRGFRATGGRCEGSPAVMDTDMSDTKMVLTAMACKAVGGQWKGGHDVSGHVFMLVLGSAFLALELFGTSGSATRNADEGRRKDRGDGENVQTQTRIWAERFVYLVIGLSWWMLLMTGVWFHTWLEKFSGLAIAFGAIYVIYFLPRGLPAWRGIVGVPES